MGSIYVDFEFPVLEVVTLDSAYNEIKYVEILLRYRQLFVKDDVFIDE